MEKTGYFACDASFDRDTKTYMIASVNLKTKKPVFQMSGQSKNVTEAEERAIYETLKRSVGKFRNVTIFSDSRGAVIRSRKKVLKESGFFKRKFDFIQIVWIERGDNVIADYLSKSPENEDVAEKNASAKIESMANGIMTVSSILFSDKEKILKTIEKIKNLTEKEKIDKPLKILSKKNLTAEDIKEDAVECIAANPETEKYFALLLSLIAPPSEEKVQKTEKTDDF